MTASRYLWGGLAWLLTLQFFVVETVAAAGFAGYSRTTNVISDLGTALSPDAGLMNASFLLQGVLIAVGAVVLAPKLEGTAGRAAGALLLLSGVGVVLVGAFPSDANGTLHGTGATAHLLGGGAGLIALAYAVRPRSEAVGTTLALLGLLGIIGTIFFGTAVFGPLGAGGMERVAAYPIPLGLALAGVSLWRSGDDWASRAAPADDGSAPTRRQQRQAEREEAAERARKRDDALESAARAAERRRSAPSATPAARGPAEGPDGDEGPDEDEDFDQDNPWGARRTD